MSKYYFHWDKIKYTLLNIFDEEVQYFIFCFDVLENATVVSKKNRITLHDFDRNNDFRSI